MGIGGIQSTIGSLISQIQNSGDLGLSKQEVEKLTMLLNKILGIIEDGIQPREIPDLIGDLTKLGNLVGGDFKSEIDKLIDNLMDFLVDWLKSCPCEKASSTAVLFDISIDIGNFSMDDAEDEGVSLDSSSSEGTQKDTMMRAFQKRLEKATKAEKEEVLRILRGFPKKLDLSLDEPFKNKQESFGIEVMDKIMDRFTKNITQELNNMFSGDDGSSAQGIASGASAQ